MKQQARKFNSRRMKMKKVTKILALAGAIAALTIPQATRAGGNGAAAFEQLKVLAGHWEAQPAGEVKATLDVELTSGGTALIERSHMVEGGKEVEMITLYYLDGDQLKLTHYCMAGNQPTMRASYAPDTKTLTFEFESATNLKSANDGHMHHAVYTFLDSDHFKMAWTYRKDQQDAFTEDVTYARVK
jgi:hypothetical protein